MIRALLRKIREYFALTPIPDEHEGYFDLLAWMQCEINDLCVITPECPEPDPSSAATSQVYLVTADSTSPQQTTSPPSSFKAKSLTGFTVLPAGFGVLKTTSSTSSARRECPIGCGRIRDGSSPPPAT